MSEPSPPFGDLLVKLGLVSAAQVEEALALQALSGQRVGEALISLGYVSRDQLQSALAEALGLGELRPLERPPLGELLIGLRHATPEQLDRALLAQEGDGRLLGEILVDQGACTYRQIYEALGLQQRMTRGATGPAQEEPRPQGRRVMVVDDSELAAQVVDVGLTTLGYQVCTFQDPYQALEQVFRLEPAIVLTDLEMPGLSGAELCRRLKLGPGPSVPVIVLTGHDGEAHRVSGLRAGADDYLSKSVSMEELAARIESVLRRTGEAAQVRQLFARYTSEAVVEEILRRGEVVLTGEKREVTLLFADLRSFTTLAESLPPEEVVALLNRVLGPLSEAVLTCGGTLDKYLGDGLMAVFGAPVARPDDATRAMQAARMMLESMEQLREELREEQAAGRRGEVPALRLGVGVNSGWVVAGNIGSKQRTEYTCIGDAVNVAARLCALAGPDEILLGERTREQLGEMAGLQGPFPQQLKGRSQPVPVYRAAWRERRAEGEAV
jgi:adenylate cyclase